MTWKHVCLVTLALATVLTCGLFGQCTASLPQIIQLATMVVGGVVGHARGGADEEIRKALKAREPTAPPGA